MASRVNKRFVFLLITICSAVAILVGGIALWAVRQNPYLNVRNGDAAIAEGNVRLAMREYARACNKAPSDLGYLAKFEDALLKIRPDTHIEASELYRLRLTVYASRVRLRAANADYHLDYIRELYQAAKLTGDIGWWEQLANIAETALSRVARSDPKYPEIQSYKLIADAHQIDLMTTDRVDKLVRDFEEFIQENPESDRAQAEYAEMLLRQAENLRFARSSAAAEEKEDRAREVLAKARESVAESPYLALAHAREVAVLARRPDTGYTRDDVRAAANYLYEMMKQSDNALILDEAATLLPYLTGIEGLEQAIEIMEDYVREHPDDIVQRWNLCWIHFERVDLERCEEQAQRILNSEPIPVSFRANYRFYLRRLAAKKLFDIAFIRASGAQESEYEAALDKARQARETLAAIVPDPNTDLMLAECDGWLAIADKNYLKAATKFNEVINKSTQVEVRTLIGAAAAFENQNAPGDALRALVRALERSPGNVRLLLDAARLEVSMGMYDDARQHANQVLEIEEDNEQAKFYLAQAAQAVGDQTGAEHPIARIITQAEDLFNEGDYEGARTILLAGTEEHPESYGIFHALVMAEVQGGWKDEALARVEQKLAEYPENQDLRQLLSVVRGDDPIERLRGIVNVRFDGESARAVAMYTGLRQMAARELATAQQLRAEGNRDEAAEAEERAASFNDAADTWRDQAGALAPHDPSFLDQRFRDALNAGDFETARKIVETARATNADQARGLIFQGRLELARGDFRAAVYTLQDATRALPFSAWVWRALAGTYEQLGNVPDAIAAYEHALERQPNDLQTIRMYASLLVNAGKVDAALTVLRRAASQQRNRADFRLVDLWLHTEAEAGNELAAIGERRRIYREDPSNRLNALRLATLLAVATPTRAAIVDPRTGREQFAEREWLLMRETDRAKVVADKRAEWRGEAEQIFADLEKTESQNFGFLLAKAQFLRDTGRPVEGFDLLVSFVQSQPPESRTASMFIGLAQYLGSIGRHREAITALQEGIPYQSQEDREVDAALANTFFTSGQIESARDHYVKVLEVTESPSVLMQLVDCEIRLGNFEVAQSRMAQLDETVGVGYQIELLRARLMGARGRHALATASEGDPNRTSSRLGTPSDATRFFREQRAAIDRAIELDPAQPQAYVERATTFYEEFIRGGRRRPALLDTANIALTNALEKRADYMPALTLRAELLLAKSPPDVTGAISQLDRLLAQNPRNDSIRQRVVDLHMRNGNRQQALEVAAAAIALDPGSARWYNVAGSLLERSGQFKEAAALYDRAWQQTDMSPSILVRWGEAMLQSRDSAAAAGVTRRLGGMADTVNAVPGLQCVYARSLLQTGAKDAGLAQLKLAFGQYDSAATQQNQPGLITDWFLHLTRTNLSAAEIDALVTELAGESPTTVETYWHAELLKMRQHGSSRAIELYEKALSQTRADNKADRVEILIGLGQNYWLLKNYEAARDAYQRVIEIDPENARARNDLAYTMAAGLDRAEDALVHAQKAVELMPDNANFLDTLGTVYLVLGQFPKAEEALQRSVDLEPSAENQFHLAQVFVQQNRKATARELLEQALQMNPSPSTEEEIRQLLTDITQ